MINVRPKNCQTICLGIVVENFHRIGAIHIGRQCRGHERCCVVRLQPGGVIRHYGVSSRMRFIESVLGKLFHQIEKLHSQPFVDRTLFSTFTENIAVLCHFFGFFLTHCPPQHIRCTQRITTDQLGNLHHLFLIHDHAIGRRQTGLKRLMEVFDFLQAFFTQNKVIYHARAQ